MHAHTLLGHAFVSRLSILLVLDIIAIAVCAIAGSFTFLHSYSLCSNFLRCLACRSLEDRYGGFDYISYFSL